MTNEIPAWLPALVLFSDYEGNWERYVDALIGKANIYFGVG